MSSWVGASGTASDSNSWLVFDFGKSVSLDGFRLYSAGDSIHDITKHFLQAATPSSTPGSVTWGKVAGQFVGQKSTKAPQDFTFPPMAARVWRWAVTDVVSSGLCPGAHCQADVAEVEFRHAGNKTFTANTGTANNSLVISSSGASSTENLAWKAVDGVLLYSDYKEGWDAGVKVGPPDAPKVPTAKVNKTSWKWDGDNGNNAVWYGSTKAGVRLELKGEDPLWWAGSPYDSGRSPEPPDSWSNGKRGRIDGYSNGTAVAFSGARSMVAGQSISYVFSMMVTPVRPFDLQERFRDRWAQLSGPTNYSQLAADGVTVVNMHQGNEINPWINYPVTTPITPPQLAFQGSL